MPAGRCLRASAAERIPLGPAVCKARETDAGQAPLALGALRASRVCAQRGCRCPHGGHGLARPIAGEDGEEAAAAETETVATRLGPGREPRGRSARAGPREHVGPERGAGCAAAGAAALLGPDAELRR